MGDTFSWPPYSCLTLMNGGDLTVSYQLLSDVWWRCSVGSGIHKTSSSTRFKGCTQPSSVLSSPCLPACISLPLSLSLSEVQKKNQTTDISPVNQMIHEITTINLAAIKIVLAKWLCSNYAIQYTEWDPLHYTMWWWQAERGVVSDWVVCVSASSGGRCFV